MVKFGKKSSIFLAPTGAQEKLMFVRPSVSNLSKTVIHHLSRSESNQRTQRAFRASKSESYNWSLKYCVLLKICLKIRIQLSNCKQVNSLPFCSMLFLEN